MSLSPTRWCGQSSEPICLPCQLSCLFAPVLVYRAHLLGNGKRLHASNNQYQWSGLLYCRWWVGHYSTFFYNRHYWTLITLECGTIRFAWLRFRVHRGMFVCLKDGGPCGWLWLGLQLSGCSGATSYVWLWWFCLAYLCIDLIWLGAPFVCGSQYTTTCARDDLARAAMNEPSLGET